MPKETVKAVDVRAVEKPSQSVPVQELLPFASIPEKTLENQSPEKYVLPCSVLKRKTVAGITFIYSTEGELHQKMTQELDRIQMELEGYERRLEVLDKRKETLGLFRNAMEAFPWLGEALMACNQRKEALELERRYLTLREAAVRLGVKPSTMYHWVSMRKIPFIKLNSKAVRFNIQALDQWVDGGTMPSAKEVQKHGTLQARKDLVA